MLGLKVIVAAAAIGLVLAASAAAASDQYVVRSLVSNDTTLIPADRADPNLINPWGLVSSPTSPWWAANQGTSTSTLYPATGALNSLVVSVAGGPTGTV